MGQLRKRGGRWQIRYRRNGRLYEESTGSTVKQVAIDLLKAREGDGVKGIAITPQIGRFTFQDAAEDLLNDYRTNDKRSIDEVERRLRKHLAPFFGGRRMASLSTADVRRYVAARQADTVRTRAAYSLTRKDGTQIRVAEQTRDVGTGASNAEINRELTLLKRMFTLAIQAGKLLHKPYIPLLHERNTRTGFFEREQFLAVRAELPPALQPVIEFAYITGWRIDSEILPLEWRQVDFVASEVRLDPHTTKNDDGRVFPMTDDLRALLEAQQVAREALQRAGHLVPWVFFRLVGKGRRGPKVPRAITAFTTTWKNATIAAGCPGRIPHDFRRTAVRNMVRRGVPERVAMQLTGHKTRSVFERYNIVSDGDLRTAADQLRGLTGPWTKHGQSAEIADAVSAKVGGSLRKSGGAVRI
jgi:integrase